MSQSTYAISRNLFGRGLGLCSAIAFVSIWVQIEGLVGKDGILPVGAFLRRVLDYTQSESVTWEAFSFVPSLFWLSHETWFLHLVCGVGLAASAALIAGLVPRWAALIAWVCYLSICTVGQVFLGYQWDALLLECLFVGAFFLPGGLTLTTTKRTGPMLWVMWLLLFKLMFLSGVVKLASGDPTWAGLTALDYHFWSQPLPTWSSYYVDMLPSFVLMAGCALTLFFELVAPFGIVLGKWGRRAAAACFAVLMVAIVTTGTYGFFNLLTLALVVLLIDDELITRAWPISESTLPDEDPHPVQWFVALVLAALISVPMVLTVSQSKDGFLAETYSKVAGFRTFNRYGLFATMTTERMEIIVEGSVNGRDWRRYEFNYKPSATDVRPDFATPHMPRLDWQMWFASLGTCESNGWFVEFQHHLLLGTPEVLDLMEHVPFDEPPRFIRTPTFDYRFGDEDWWKATPRDEHFCPPLTLREGKLRRAILNAN